MEIKDFFRFTTIHSSSSFQASASGLGCNKDGVDDEYNLIRGEYGTIHFPVIFTQARGKKILDILDTGWPNLCLVSDKLKTILEEKELTGWKTFPIKLYDKKKNEIFGYHGFSVTGRCGPIDHTKAEIVDRQRIPTGPVFKAYNGLYVGLDKWDGSDFFIPEHSIYLIISKKTSDILKDNNITNTQINNLTEIETPARDILINNQVSEKIERES